MSQPAFLAVMVISWILQSTRLIPYVHCAKPKYLDVLIAMPPIIVWPATTDILFIQEITYVPVVRPYMDAKIA